MTVDLNALSVRLIKLGEKLGADEVEVYINETWLRSIALVKGVESLGSSYMSGLGIRVVESKRIGQSSTTSLNPYETEQAVRRAHSIAKINQPNGDWVSLVKNMGGASVEGVLDPEIQELRPENMSEAALEMLRTVREEGAELLVTRGGILTGIRTTTIANNYGQTLRRSASFASASISVSTCGASPKGLGSESDESHSWRGLDVDGICHVASDRAIAAAKARSIPSGVIPIIWRNKLFASVLAIMFGGTLSADSIQKKRSPWAGKIGSKIAAADFTLIDEGLAPGCMGTREFDDEGVPQRHVPLIEKGVLKAYLYDTFTANKDHMESTGNASRSYDNMPRPAPNNLLLGLGTLDSDEIIEETKQGLYLQEVIGLWLSNPISGYLSATAANAMLIDKGEMAQPVKGVLVSGSFFEILQSRIDLIGRDVDHTGGNYSPTVRVTPMSVTPQ
ncbi:TldD/PmbA family protein [Candidatus Bathyarchaeota archaeon]|nr:TldD/PmbA family protein [Candidatus Bathyarchaeota archaeon]